MCAGEVVAQGSGAGGLPLHVERAGGEGDPIVLLHGFGASNFTWRFWAPELARRHRLFLVEPMRFPRGRAPTADYHTPLGQARLVRELILREDLRRVTLVGHSLGGGIALLTALELLEAGEDRVLALVLVCGAAYPQQIPPFISLARVPVLGGIALALLPARWIVRLVLRVICHDPATVSEEQVEAYAGVLESKGGRQGLIELARNIVPDEIDSITGRFCTIPAPTLLLWGDHDPVVPIEIGRRLLGDLQDAELRVIEGCGHIPPEERPRESLAVVETFLGRVSGGGTGSSAAPGPPGAREEDSGAGGAPAVGERERER